MKYILFFVLFITISFSDTYIFKDKFYSLKKISNNLYLDENSKEVFVKNSFFTKIKQGIDIDIIIKQYNLKIVKKYSNQLFLLENKVDNDIDLLSKIQQVNDDENIVYAHPNFLKKLQTR